MKNLHVFLLCLGLLINALVPTIGQAIDPKEVPRLSLAMEVFLKRPQAAVYALEIHLTNTSEDVVTVNVRDLPWNPPNASKWFSVFRMDTAGSPVEQRAQDWHLGSRVIQLLPGESIQDILFLNLQIPSLLDDIEQFGVQFRWDCPPADLKIFCQKNSFSMLTIPQGDSGQPDVYSIDESVCKKLEKAIGLINIPEGHTVLFLLTPESVIVDLSEIQVLLYQVDDYVRLCQPSWTNSWGVSFFTDGRYAGFLSEAKRKADFKRGIWQEVNIGQYSSQIRTLFRFPWIKKRADDVYLSVHR